MTSTNISVMKLGTGSLNSNDSHLQHPMLINETGLRKENYFILKICTSLKVLQQKDR